MKVGSIPLRISRERSAKLAVRSEHVVASRARNSPYPDHGPSLSMAPEISLYLVPQELFPLISHQTWQIRSFLGHRTFIPFIATMCYL
jgi:hypothetical protein